MEYSDLAGVQFWREYSQILYLKVSQTHGWGLNSDTNFSKSYPFPDVLRSILILIRLYRLQSKAEQEFVLEQVLSYLALFSQV